MNRKARNVSKGGNQWSLSSRQAQHTTDAGLYNPPRIFFHHRWMREEEESQEETNRCAGRLYWTCYRDTARS